MKYLTEQFETLRQKGIICYEYEYDFLTTIQDFITSPGNKVAGRIFKLSSESSTITLKDSSSKIEVVLSNTEHNNILLGLLAVGDIVGIEGTYDADRELFDGDHITLLTKTRVDSKEPVARDHQLKLRHLTYINDEEAVKRIYLRSETVKLLRHLLDEDQFLEIDTPLLHPFQGDSTSKPIFARPSAYDDLQFALASSPELYLKKMLVSGFNRVFTINKVFRDEPIDDTHLMEFSSIEYYMAYVDYHFMMDYTEMLLKKLAKGVTGKTILPFRGHEIDFGQPWERVSIHDSLIQHFDQDLYVMSYEDLLLTAKAVGLTYGSVSSPGNVIIDIFEKLFLPTFIQPTFIYDFPKDASVMCYDITMAKDHRENQLLLERFELYIGGMEIANCYSELNDPEAQRQAFDNFLKQRNKELSMDATFYHALQVGMPPASGVGFGIDRLMMVLTNSNQIIDVAPFSTYHESI